MNRARIRRAGWLIAAISLLGCGCNSQDTERLARIGRLALDKVGDATNGAPDKLSAKLHSVQGNAAESGVEGRVLQRLRWDKGLADTSIQVHLRNGDVVLSGKVPNLQQRQRAYDLAKSTSGVLSVKDEMESPDSEAP